MTNFTCVILQLAISDNNQSWDVAHAINSDPHNFSFWRRSIILLRFGLLWLMSSRSNEVNNPHNIKGFLQIRTCATGWKFKAWLNFHQVLKACLNLFRSYEVCTKLIPRRFLNQPCANIQQLWIILKYTFCCQSLALEYDTSCVEIVWEMAAIESPKQAKTSSLKLALFKTYRRCAVSYYHADMHVFIESAQRTLARQAVSATHSLNAGLIIRVIIDSTVLCIVLHTVHRNDQKCNFWWTHSACLGPSIVVISHTISAHKVSY